MFSLSSSLMLTAFFVEKTIKWEPSEKDTLLKKIGKQTLIFTICAVVIPIFALLSAGLQAAAFVIKIPFFIIATLSRPFTDISDELSCSGMLIHIKKIACLATAILLTPTVLISLSLNKSLYIALELGYPENHEILVKKLEDPIVANVKQALKTPLKPQKPQPVPPKQSQKEGEDNKPIQPAKPLSTILEKEGSSANESPAVTSVPLPTPTNSTIPTVSAVVATPQAAKEPTFSSIAPKASDSSVIEPAMTKPTINTSAIPTPMSAALIWGVKLRHVNKEENGTMKHL
jgi:hypothetical protein